MLHIKANDKFRIFAKAMAIKVLKFGGASVKDAGAIRNAVEILNKFSGEQIILVLSAMGKMTNAFEDLVNAWFNNEDYNNNTGHY